MTAATAQWTCSDSGWVASQPVAWLRFDANAWTSQELPRHFFTRIARFDSMTLAAVQADGSIREVTWREADGEPFAAGPVHRLDLPVITPDTTAVIVRIAQPHSIPMLTEARISHARIYSDWSQLDVMLLAMVLGMLILPLCFDVSFFIVLREKFVLLHAAIVTGMIGYVLFAGGLISVFATLPVTAIAVAGPLFFAIGVGCSALFLAAFLEPGAQSPIMRKMTLALGWWTILVPGFFSLQLGWTQPFDDPGYFYAFLPVIAGITAALGEALWRGSRSARFVAAAWLPILAASIERLLRGLGVHTGPSTLDQMLFVATGLEVIIISLAVADRFFALRRERDEALIEARSLEQLTERDPLTGLLNRRAIDSRFVDLHRAGYETFALIDLDHFKLVNDTAGHATGDRVLQIVAEALSADSETIAMRLGGEEFLLLMRGAGGEARAERLRRSIPVRVANSMPGLGTVVTASMGVIAIPRNVLPDGDFADIYSRADMLLYDAKAQGRNRTVSEKLRAFIPRRDERRKPRKSRAA